MTKDSSVSKGDLKLKTGINQIYQLFQRSAVGFRMPSQPISLEYITKGNNSLTKSPSVSRNNLMIEMTKCLQKFLPQPYTNYIYLFKEKRLSLNQNNGSDLY